MNCTVIGYRKAEGGYAMEEVFERRLKNLQSSWGVSETTNMNKLLLAIDLRRELVHRFPDVFRRMHKFIHLPKLFIGKLRNEHYCIMGRDDGL